MRYLNVDTLNSIGPEVFWATEPYPWINPVGVLTEEAFEILRTHLPPLELFEKSFNIQRSYGQKPHDRYELVYEKGIPVAQCWQELIQELEGHEYRSFLEKMFKTSKFMMRFHWHYASAGHAISPHCDARIKLGSHIFYLNTEDDWQDEWGGHTLVLHDEKKFDYRSNPEFSDFRGVIASKLFPNRSFIFARTDHSWHAMRPLVSPPDALRKVFIIVIDHKMSLAQKVHRFGRHATARGKQAVKRIFPGF